MGIWQLAQASSVFGLPLHTIYPHRPNEVRNDLNRMFFPVDVQEIDDEPIVIMWTGLRTGTVPIHFVPLLKDT